MVGQDTVRIPDLGRQRKKRIPRQTDTSFQSVHMKLSPFLFCAYTADTAKQVTAVFERDSTLGYGWSIHQLPLMCLALLYMYKDG